MQHSSATISDGGLVRRTLAGDPDGFGELHRRYYARVVGVVTGILKDRARAEEEVQEAYLTALESLPRLADRERFYPWLRRIAVNRAIEAMAALAPSNSSRVLIKGVRLAAGHIAPPAVREALRPLLSGGVSTWCSSPPSTPSPTGVQRRRSERSSRRRSTPISPRA